MHEHDDATCPYKQQVLVLEEKLETLLGTVAHLQQRMYGKRSEKMPPMAHELRLTDTREEAEARRLRGLQTRREHKALRKNLEEQTITHHVSEDKKRCFLCSGTATVQPGMGKETHMLEYVPGYFVRQRHIQEKVACACGGYVATANPPRKVIDKGQYGPGFIAHLCTMKCADAIPLHRLAKQYQRLGMPIGRQTLTDLFHAAAEKVEPLAKRLLRLIAEQPIVQGDETPIKMLKPERKGYMWTFIADKFIGYVFAGDRSSETPVAVLGGSEGTLVVDAYTGYNAVTDVDGRVRAGCLAHVRRKFFDAKAQAPEVAATAMAHILEVYRIEQIAKAQKINGTPAHLELRQDKSRAAMAAFHAFLLAQEPRHTPKSAIGGAIRYAINQWSHLQAFLEDARIPPDNNISEAALRIVALGRKNFLFVHDEDSGKNLGNLYSLVATCEANNVDPVDYLTDVLIRIDYTKAKDIDDLLPHRWRPSVPYNVAA